MKKFWVFTLTMCLSTMCLFGCGKSEGKVAETPEVLTETVEKETSTEEAETKEAPDETKELSMDEQLAASITFDNAEDSGVCGADLYWLYKDNVLVIRGTGDMVESAGTPPWDEVREKIVKVIIEEGCTSIGDYAFSTCRGKGTVTQYIDSLLASISIPSTVKEIGEEAFSGCDSITSIIKELKSRDVPEKIEINADTRIINSYSDSYEEVAEFEDCDAEVIFR